MPYSRAWATVARRSQTARALTAGLRRIAGSRIEQGILRFVRARQRDGSAPGDPSFSQREDPVEGVLLERKHGQPGAPDERDLLEGGIGLDLG